MALHVALLRGINVGGKNMIRMPALKDCFEAAGFEDVATYIQSGNVLFRAAGSGPALESRVEKMLGKAFGHYKPTVMIRSRSQMRSIVEKAPKSIGADLDNYMYDVVFLKEPLTAAKALKQVPVRDEVDEVYAGRGVIYFSRVTSMRTKSRLSRVASLPIYKSMTIRSWSTTTRLLRMMDEAR
ncbi:MAG TPA: DUF1697 domain-containing protein [Actinomycetota bacterium]|nr:DUF1697 domain-containing protein [Actinomycetota bacterium]